MKTKGGWHGRILKIDLSRKNWEVEVLEADVYVSFIGGKALAGYLFSQFPPAPSDDSSTPVVIATGPLAATPAYAGGFATIFSHSPLTGSIGDYSFPGSMGTALKTCGYDAVVLYGTSSTTTGISITEKDIDFYDASALTGLPVTECRKRLSPQFPQIFVGAAADFGNAQANIITDELWARGRNGLGICFSRKNVKFVRFCGSSLTHIHDPKRLHRAQESIRRLLYASPALMGEFGISRYGTGALFDLLDTRRMMPTDLFKHTVFKGASAINACRFHQHFSPQTTGCTTCPVQCMRKTPDGKALADLEAMLSFGPQLFNDNIDAIQSAASLCNEYGLDAISTALQIASRAKKDHTHNPAKQLHDHIWRFAKDYKGDTHHSREETDGLNRYATHEFCSKHQDLPPFDPRGGYGMALSMAVSTCGAYDSAFSFSHEILRKPVATDRFSFSGKARMTELTENTQAAFASLAVCRYVSVAVPLEEYAEVLGAITGIDFSTEMLIACGKRALYQERMLNAGYGFTSENDSLPAYFFSHSGTPGNGISVPALPESEFIAARQSYYKIRGLTPEGQPTGERAQVLGLQWKK